MIPPELIERYLQESPHVEIVTTRWVDTLNSQPWEPDRHKARLVVRGDPEPDGAAKTDSPTCSQMLLSMVLSYAASYGYKLRGGDITAAFLQEEKITRRLVLSLPKDGIEGVAQRSLLVANKPVYGTRDAPRGFLPKTSQHHSGRRTIRPIPPEHAAYVLNTADGGIVEIMVSHVDDLLWAGNDEMQKVMKNMQNKLKFGGLEEGDTFRYCGRTISQKDDGISVSCPTTVKIRPIAMTSSRRAQRTSKATDLETNQLRSVIGSLNWVSRACRPDIAYQLSSLQAVQRSAMVQDLLDCNHLLAHVQQTSDHGLFYKYHGFDFEKAVILSVTDASHAADFAQSASGMKMGHRSQSGRMLRSVLDGLRRPHHGDQWKVTAMDNTKLYLITDCRSLESHLLQAGLGSTGNKRLAIDLSALRRAVWRDVGESEGDPFMGRPCPKELLQEPCGSTQSPWSAIA